MYDSLALAAVVAELNAKAVGLRVNKVRQPGDLTVVLHLGAGGGARCVILASAEAQAARLYAATAIPPNPDVPPSFSQRARPILEGARLIEVAQPSFDRVARLVFERGPVIFELIVELMARHSNIVLIEESGKILDAVKHVSHKDNRFRQIQIGKKYLSPPAGERLSPLDATPSQIEALVTRAPADEPLATFLHRSYFGFSKQLVNEFAVRIGVGEQTPMSETPLGMLIDSFDWLSEIVSTEAYHPTLYVDASGRPVDFWPVPISGTAHTPSPTGMIGEAAERFYGESIQQGEFAQKRNQLMQSIQGEMKRLERLIVEIEKDIVRNSNFPTLRMYGEVLLANLYQVAKGSDQVVLPNVYNPDQCDVTIALASDKSPHENAERYFDKARKAEASIEHSQRRLLEMQEARSRFQDLLARVEPVAKTEDLDPLRAELRAMGIGSAQPAAAKREKEQRDELSAKGVRHIVSRDGYEILWGKNATGNDYLTVHASAPTDIWMHARGCASAHVVIRSKGAPDRVPHSTILEAAKIAAQTSEAKHSSVVPVDYTLRKHVRRQRGAKLGLATYEREKTLHVEP